MRREDFFREYFRPLQCLRVLCETGNMSDAAQLLGLSKGQISKVIARLESDFREPLFVRSASGSEPTDTAKQLQAFVSDCEQRYSSAFPETFSLRHSDFTITIGTDSFSRSVLWPKLIAKFNALAPNARFHVRDLVSASTDDCDITLTSSAMDSPFVPTQIYSDTLSIIRNSVHGVADKVVLGPDPKINHLLCTGLPASASFIELPCFYSVIDTVSECAAWSIVPRQLANRVIALKSYPIDHEDIRGSYQVYLNVRQSVASHPKITPFVHFVSRFRF